LAILALKTLLKKKINFITLTLYTMGMTLAKQPTWVPFLQNNPSRIQESLAANQ
jgi:hypothetical protein